MFIPEDIFLTDQDERLLLRIGVPRELRKSKLTEVSFKPTRIWGGAFSAKVQRSVLTNWIRTMTNTVYHRRKPFLGVITSTPTSYGALHCCAAIFRDLAIAKVQQKTQQKIFREGKPARKMLSTEARATIRLELKLIELDEWIRPQGRPNREPDLVVFKGLTNTATSEKYELVKKAINYYYKSARILAVGGVNNPEDWARTRLDWHPDVAFSVQDFDPKDGPKKRRSAGGKQP